MHYQNITINNIPDLNSMLCLKELLIGLACIRQLMRLFSFKMFIQTLFQYDYNIIRINVTTLD